MIQGTGSGVGKSLVTAGLCRILADRGLRVAPFKAQNMALNSAVTPDGGEIGRAQAVQAEAARVEPHTDMNPVLLKAEGEARCQVVIDGRLHASLEARDYYRHRDRAWKSACAAYDRLAARYDVIVMEGAGSPAEINLSREEIVNMNMARHADASVLLVGDIDKGGVFASLYGTVALLGRDAGRIRGFVINKFRGDRTILEPGLERIRELTGIPVLGVLPYLHDLGIHEEDAIPDDRLRLRFGNRPVRIAVLRHRFISNFTDFDPFLAEPDVDLFFTASPADLRSADLVIVPGSKNTAADLALHRELGTADALAEAARAGLPVIGVCGGFQMLGRTIEDPDGLEGPAASTPGLGLLPVETVIAPGKLVRRVRATPCGAIPGIEGRHPDLEGYEIHLGRTRTPRPLLRIETGDGGPVHDGAAQGNVWGTYLHGLFDHDGFRRELVDWIRRRKGLGPLGRTTSWRAQRDAALDRWAARLEAELDLDRVMEWIHGKRPTEKRP